MAALVASCGGGKGASNGKAPGGGVPTSCDAIAEFSSYRYSVALKLQAPGPQTTSPTPGQTAGAPLTAFADALTRLFSDFTLEGAYLAPDRSQAILRFGDEELELRTIGEKSWLRVGAAWQEEQASDDGLLTPLVVCNDIVLQIAPSLANVEAQAETVNGIQTAHYRLDQTSLEQLPQALGGRTPQKYSVDLWLAQPGRWPVQMRIESADVNEKGEPLGFTLSMDVRDLNDQGIRIEPPVMPEAAH